MRYRRLIVRPRRVAAWVLAPVVLLAAAVSCDRQTPAGVDDLTPQPRFAKLPADPVEVDDFDPKEGEQGQTFPMTVRGSGFANGAKVVFVLDGEDVSTIETTTTSVNEAGTELTADVSISLEAVVSENYRVAVQLRRSRGVGTESFKVKIPPGQLPPGDPAVITFEDAVGHKIVSDARGPYEHGVCGVLADVGNLDDARLDPDADPITGRAKKTCGDPRFLTFIFDTPAVGGPPKDNRSDGIFMNVDDVLTVTDGAAELRIGQFNLCGRLIFNPDDPYAPGNGSDRLLVDYAEGNPADPSDDLWTVRNDIDTDGDGVADDLGFCEGDGRLYHMPFSLTVRRK